MLLLLRWTQTLVAGRRCGKRVCLCCGRVRAFALVESARIHVVLLDIYDINTYVLAHFGF